MEKYIIESKINLFIQNYEQIKEVKGFWGLGMMQYNCALSLAIKNQRVNKEKIEENLKIIKDNTGIFSNFRNHSMYYIATLLSNKTNVESEFKEILNIYELLKNNKFINDTYLPFVAIILYENKDKIDLNTCIDKMKYSYEFMKKHHPFLTSSDDYCRIALIAINSKNLDRDLNYIEQCYEKLSSNGFIKSNNLQSLSHIMCFDKKRNDESINKMVRFKDKLKKEKCQIDSNAYPILGALSLLDYNEDILINEIKKASDEIKKVKGCGNWSLGKSNRNMISSAIVASAYIDYLKYENNIHIIANNIFVDIIIAIEIACMVTMITSLSVVNSANTVS